jgi:hypothetical protein
LRPQRILVPVIAVLALAAGASQASAAGGGSAQPAATANTGGAGVGTPVSAPSTPAHPTVPGVSAKIIHGVAYAPAMAPIQVQRAIWAGNQIRTKPYRVGGGHGKWNDTAYDCSGAVSFLLHAAGLLKVSEDSGEMESWGHNGLGQWITVYTNPGHAFIQIAGIRFDTSREGDPHPAAGTGPRWRPIMQSVPGFMKRHPATL